MRQRMHINLYFTTPKEMLQSDQENYLDQIAAFIEHKLGLLLTKEVSKFEIENFQYEPEEGPCEEIKE